MADWDFILAPSTVTVEIVLDEVAVLSNSLKMITAEEFFSGLHEWIRETAYELTPEQRTTTHHLVHFIDHFVAETNAASFPAFITAVRNFTPDTVLDIALHWMREKDDYPGDDILLADQTTYLQYVESLMSEKYAKKGEDFEKDYWLEQWQLLQDPAGFLQEASDHLQFMWDNYLKAEWQRVKPMLQEAVDAFRAVDYDGMNAYDAIEAVTSRNMRGKDFFEERLEKVDTLIFMPNAHLGPYISWGVTRDDRTMLFFFGARPPKNVTTQSTALGRSELLVRLNALADETRLKILEMLTEREELCAQDFITGLDLSQSSASRHLRQLTASGYLNERRRDVAKCYSLNADRVDDTIRALKSFLKKS